jgi:hypothetical protein
MSLRREEVSGYFLKSGFLLDFFIGNILLAKRNKNREKI